MPTIVVSDAERKVELSHIRVTLGSWALHAPLGALGLLTGLLLGLLLSLLLSLFATQNAWSQIPSKVRPPGYAAASDPASTAYRNHNEAMQFAQALDAAQGWSDGWAQRWVGQAQRQARVIQLIRPAPAGTLRDWHAYRDRFVEPRRLRAGQRFWREHAETLARAEATYGVPAWLIVGIIGVETLYGEHTGTFKVLDALTTLSFDFPAEHPRRAERVTFFRQELAAFLQKTRDANTPPDRWLGSFAGAIGLPQFMPSNWGRFGVDFDGDGQVDLLNSPADAIGSVANYIKGFGWRTGMPTHYPVAFAPQRLDLDTLLAPDILPSFTVSSMTAKGAVLKEEALNHIGPLALVELENGSRPRSYVAGTENFYVITRYNWSSYYAMAVIELGQAVKALGLKP
jgi:membrane-bound lytic murein transglycosylase B